MPNEQLTVKARRMATSTGVALIACMLAGVPSLRTALADSIPERCLGYGALQSTSQTDWESGLGTWVPDKQGIASPGTFDTPDWAVAGSLPDGRTGSAAFVANLVLGDCAADDETGMLTLRSPSISIPAGTAVPRISVDHWFQTEFGWDGGHFKISVNGGSFSLIPTAAIETVPYNDTLFPALDEFGSINNTNPLAGQKAYTATHDGQPDGDWVQSRINLLGIAGAGDSVRLRLDFGLDGCTIANQVPAPVGWYVDEVEFYRCEAELPPSDCGNGVIDGIEQCDDGNDFIGDGCSNVCTIEDGWQCAAPTPPGTIPDPGFEAGRPNPFWDEVSNNFLGSPICDTGTCGFGQGTGPFQGSFWVWLGGITPYQQGSVSQSVTIPATVSQLTFQLEVPRCDSAADYVELLVDGNQEWFVDGSSALCGQIGYVTQTVDISAYADGGAHAIEFHSETFSVNGSHSNFFIDSVAMPGSPSSCRREGTSLTLVKNVHNDDGGTALTSDWTLAAAGPSGFSGPGRVVWGGELFQAGTYDLSESGGASVYAPSAWLCEGGSQVDGDTISVATDEAATCTITNDDIAPTLTLLNTIVNDNGGTVTDPDAFGPKVDGLAVQYDMAQIVEFGDHVVSQDGLAGYQSGAWGGDCAPDGSVTVLTGENAVCTITNDDISPTLTLFKNIVNDNGGTVTDPDAFGLTIDGEPVLHGVVNAVNAGTRMASENGLPGYAAGAWAGDCNPDGSIQLALDQDAVCTLTNDDIQPTLTLVKGVINNSGGTANASAWNLNASGPTSFGGPGPSVSSPSGFAAGTYDLSESGGPPGYGASAWSCDGGTQLDSDSVALEPGEAATCSITNDDIAPTLTLIKNIVNDDEGTTTNPDAFGLRIDGVPVAHNSPQVLIAGNHMASEDGLAGYVPGPWGGDCNPDGSITLSLDQQATCSITNDDVEPITLTLVKEVINDNGGSALPSAWTLTATGPSGFSGPGPSVSSSSGFAAGTYDLSESGGPSGYTASSWVCIGGNQVDGDSIALQPGDVASCTITNNDIAPTLKVVKTIVNDDEGTVTDPNAFELKIDGAPVLHNAVNVVDAGAHLVAETGLAGYVAGAWGGDCNGDGSIVLALNQDATCTITNDDEEPISLLLFKSLINNNGGTAQASVWTLTASGPTPISGPGPVVQSGSGFAPGTYDLSESGGPAGYAASAWVCDGGNQTDGDTVILVPGDVATCTITNNDIAAKLKLVKTIVNDDGGTVTNPDAFGLRINGLAVPNNTLQSRNAGMHTASEVGLPGYQAGAWGGDCNADGTITLTVGQVATCTIINDDIPPTLKLVKTIVNDNGGTETDPDAFGLRVDGNIVLHNAVNAFNAGNHTASEDGLPGYVRSNWGGDCNTDGGVTLSLGQDATCTITNDDTDATSLTLVKQVINDNGGTAQGSAWTLTATGLTGFSGSGPVVSNGPDFAAGTYDLSESGGPAGYSASSWVCVGGTQIDGDTITLALGQSATCTITNDDIDTTSLTLAKEVVNDDGGTTSSSAWTLAATGPRQFSGPGPQVSNGPDFSAGIYHLSESGGPAGYTASAWVCVGGNQLDADTVELALGESATCTITNDDAAPTLKVVKTIVNNNGGTVTDPNAFGLKIDGAGVLHNAINPVTAGPHTVSEDGLAGYVAGSWGGDCNADGTITLALDQDATCTITNNDTAPSLTLVKEVTNDNGGTAVAANWTLTAAGPAGFSGSGPSVSSGAGFVTGTYDLSENGPAGYTDGGWVCVGGTQNDADTVTLGLGESATCTITNDDDPPSLTLVKEVTNDNGGTAAAAAWTLAAAGPTPFSGPGPSVSGGAEFQAGTYDLSESGGPASYTASAWVCVGATQIDGDTVAVGLGQSATCTITNDDNPPGLTLVKQVTNNSGGTALASAWTLSAAGPSPFSGPGPSVSGGPTFEAGTYDLSEDGPAGYSAGAWVCSGGTQDDADTITVGLGQSATCTIINDDIAPGLTLVKQVTNDNGGTAVAANWTLSASGPTGFGGNGPSVSNGPGFKAGSYDLSESGPAGYSASAWVCVGGTQDDADTISLGLGQQATCTVTNDDSAPGLMLVKQVTNDSGGTALPSDWTLAASGPSPFSGSGPSVSNGPGFKTGTYNLSESGGPAGYTASAWVCEGGAQVDADTVSLGLGESAVCTISNDDNASSLTLAKEVTNDNGGTADASDWTLEATGPTGFSGAGPSVASGPGFEAGTYDLSESGGTAGYNASAWVCVGGSQEDTDTVTVGLGQTVTCTISNDDKTPGLLLMKQVINDNGGTALPSAWTLTASGPTGFSGPGPSVSNGAGFEAGTYDLSESGGPADYTAGSWNCSGGSQNGNQITLTLGQSATCTIVNDDDPPSLTLAKQVTNDDGGMAEPGDWTLTAAGPTGFSGPGPSIASGAGFEAGTYDLSESGGPAGYTPSAWVCVGGTQDDADTVTVDLGESATCTITNDDDAPGLTLVKQVVTDNGGSAVPSDWTLAATGPTGFSGPGPEVSNGPDFDAGTYDLSESGGPDGYSASAWVCVGGTQDDADTVTLLPGQLATCTITNDDEAASLALVKQVTNDNGGTAEPGDWTLTAAGPTGFSGAGPNVASGPGFEPGTYDLSEGGGPAGYSASVWVCVGGTQDDADTVTVQLGQSATCTIVNDDEGPGLTLVKQVTNNNGGTAAPSDWTLTATGPTGFSGPGPSVSSGGGFEAGTYDLAESGGPDGYSASAWVCVGGTQDDADTVTLLPGQSATCTITNDDEGSGLTLVKQVTNDSGGTAVPSDWTLTATGPTGFSGPGPSVSSGAEFEAGTYDLSESGGPNGYSASAWVCVGGTQDDADTVALQPGQSATCTITNDDEPAELMLVKQVINDNEGDADPSDWTLTATGPTGFSGPGPSIVSEPGFEAGTYDLSESGGPAGYSASDWVCEGGTQDDGDTITLALGEPAICTITNDDVPMGIVIFRDGFESN